MHIKLHFNFKDVLRAPRYGLSVKKMWVQFIGMVIGLALYVPLTYLAYTMAGFRAEDVWKFYHLLPLPILSGDYLAFPLKSQIIWCLGTVLFIVIQLFIGVAICKIAYEQFKGDELYEVSKALKLALRKGKATVLAPLTLLVLAFVLLGLEVGVFYLGRMPAVGGVIDAILFLLFLFVSLFIIYVMIGFVVSLFMVAPAVATTQADTFDALFETFSIINEQNWRFLVYQVILVIVKAVAVILFGFFLTAGAKITFWAMGFGYPQALFAHDVAVRFVDWFSLSIWSVRFMDLVGLSRFFALTGHAASTQATIAAGVTLGVVYYIILFLLFSYMGAVCWSGQTLVYTVLYKKKDDIDLLAQRPEAIEEIVVKKEEAPPSTGEEPPRA